MPNGWRKRLKGGRASEGIPAMWTSVPTDGQRSIANRIGADGNLKGQGTLSMIPAGEASHA